MKAAESELTFSRMSLSPHRENEVVLQLSGFRYLTEHLIEDVLFGGSSFTPLSRQVITRRVLNRLKRKGLILETPRLVGPAGGTARLMSFLTAKGYNLARSLNPGLPSRQPNLRGTSLMGHGLMCAEVALAFRRAARPNPSSTGSATGRPLNGSARSLSCQTPTSCTPLRTGPLKRSIEVDLATEGSRVFAWKIRRYLDLYRGGSWIKHVRVWPRILTIAPTQARSRILRRATETVLEAQLFRDRLTRSTAFGFTTLDELLGSHGPVGEIWSVVGESGLHPLFRAASQNGSILTHDPKFDGRIRIGPRGDTRAIRRQQSRESSGNVRVSSAVACCPPERKRCPANEPYKINIGTHA
ncbi:MAG: hypothetical protein E6I18_02935 [Chloroflexi bacterium]|nr:MAG: hypothetical protein E6I18_02935 [Chloroflexota bacterium]